LRGVYRLYAASETASAGGRPPQIQHVGAEIRAARPDQGPCLHPKTPENRSVTHREISAKDRPRQVFRQIALDYFGHLSA